MKLRRIRAVARKEFRHIWRDSRSLILALALPLVMLLLFGYALSLDVDRIPTVVYDQDQSPESRDVLARFEGSRYFDIVERVSSYEAIERRIDQGRCVMAIVVPQDFSRILRRGQSAPVQLIIDGSDSNTASIGQGYAESILRNHSLSFQASFRGEGGTEAQQQPLEPRVRILYNPEVESKNYIVPGLVAVILMIISALLTSLTIAREWETGTMEQLLSTPVRPAELVLGKLAAYFTLGALDTLVAVSTGVLLFQVPLKGSLLFLAASCFIFLVGALCWGILLSAIARNQLLAYQMSMVSSFLPAFLLSGFIYDIENMPAPIQIVTYIVPARYFIKVLKGIFLKGIGPEILAVEILFLVGFATLVFLVATRKVKQKVA